MSKFIWDKQDWSYLAQCSYPIEFMDNNNGSFLDVFVGAILDYSLSQ